MKINGHSVRSIDAHDARKLPNGTALICVRALYDYKTGRPIGAEYYRCVVETRDTALGPEKAIRFEPDSDWPGIPMWHRGWTWLEGDSVTGYYVLDDTDHTAL